MKTEQELFEIIKLNHLTPEEHKELYTKEKVIETQELTKAGWVIFIFTYVSILVYLLICLF